MWVKRRQITRLLIILALGVVGLVWPVRAVFAERQGQTTGPVQIDVRAGFDGYVQQNAWLPVLVTASNSGDDITGGTLRVEVTPFGGVMSTYYRSIDLPRGSRKQVMLYVGDISGFTGEVIVDLMARGRVAAQGRVRIELVNATTLLIGVVSDNPGVMSGLQLVTPTSGETRVALLAPEELPDLPAAWAALDVLVAADADTGRLTAAQTGALTDWVAGGGKLVIVGGLSFQRTLAGLETLSPLLAVDTQTASLEALTAADAFPFAQQTEAEGPIAVGELTPDARVMAASGSLPLIAWRAVGHGRVTFLAADPSLEPLRSWTYLPALWYRILADDEPRPSWSYGFSQQWDAARQAVSAVPGVSLPSAIQLCGFLAVYVVLVGPVNYFVLARLKKKEWSWFTIPALIVLFSGIAYITGFQLRGSRAILHRMAIIQSWPDSEEAEVSGIIGVWSPRRSRYDLSIEEGYTVRPLPQGFTSALASAAPMTMEEGEAFTLRDLRVDVGAVTPFVVEGFTVEALRVVGSLTVSPAPKGMQISGEVINYSSVDLEDVSLVTGQTVASLGDLPAGEVLEVSLPLLVGDASPLPASNIDPFPQEPYGFYPSVYESFVQKIAGGDCMSTPEQVRRCNMFLTVWNGRAHGTGIYLFGWADSVPVEMTVLNAPAEQIDSALHIVELGATLSAAEQGQIEVTPGLMTWQSDQGSPYNFYLYPPDTTRTFTFRPGGLAPPLAVETVTVHMVNPYMDQTIPRVYIYDAQDGLWMDIGAGWGDTVIGEAARFVDASGGVTLRLEIGEDSYGVSIERFDVTLNGFIQAEE